MPDSTIARVPNLVNYAERLVTDFGNQFNLERSSDEQGSAIDVMTKGLDALKRTISQAKKIEAETPTAQAIVAMSDEDFGSFFSKPLVVAKLLYEFAKTSKSDTSSLNAFKRIWDAWDSPKKPGIGAGIRSALSNSAHSDIKARVQAKTAVTQ